MEWIIIILLIVLSVLIGNIVSLKRKEKSVSFENEKLHDEKEQIMKRNLELRSINQKLSKYEAALNADEEAEDRLKRAKEESELILAGAQQQMKQIITDAENRAQEILDKADDEAESIISKSRSEVQITNDETAIIKKSNKELLQRAKDEAEKIREDATRQAALILSEAENKAKEIAGEAYDIANKAKHYEEVSKAMKNVIEGYGDEYLKPTFSLLDDLADEFGYDEAGQRLKDARERTRMLMKNGDAASCDYVEKNRKDTAINFVLDAFNGKVDTILAMIKKDNYGILEQKIQDAYSLVNYLGAAFRNARINSMYLDSRLDELKWGVAVNELKLQEREEQRRIKEQIREEEKARREYEKAMRDAAKEEETIRKAMEKAQQAIAKASEEQKAKYEAQLADLEQKLVEAEAKNQRALSMAQQTKSGHVYIISNIGSFGENVYKIGMTRRLEPLDRVRELGDASVPFPFDVHAMIYCEDAPKLETELHRFFVQNQVNKVNPRKEFFLDTDFRYKERS